MSKKRLSSTDRRDSIIDAATAVFARQGFSGAKTQDIAREAKVSEALIFRHFPTKVAIYRAVLRRMIRAQDEALVVLSGMSPDAAGIVDMLRRTFSESMAGRAALNAEGRRILFASLAGDGTYAALAYRRSLRLWLKPIELAMAGAREAGDLVGEPIPALSAFAFIEHVDSMLLLGRTHGQLAFRYAGGDETILRDAIRFCARGIGLRDAAIDAHL